MELPLHILAILGVAAASVRWLRSAVGVLRGGVEAYVAGEVARTRAHRGDLTGMEEASGAAARARRARGRSAAELALWTALLALPVWLLPSSAPAYATYASLWILPRLRRGRAAGAGSAVR
ncbi:MAG TPA: hypothetical protein VF212_12785 [Longimicrobiales bacterium]